MRDCWHRPITASASLWWAAPSWEHPIGGPPLSQALLWLAYFGAPILAATTLIDALLRVLSPHNLHLRRIRNHIVVIGTGELAMSYLRVLRERNRSIPVIVVARHEPEGSIADELRETYNAIVTTGDVTHEFCLKQLRVKRAHRVMLMSDNSLRSYEAVSVMQKMVPKIGRRIVMHCANLRFMRAMQQTEVAKSCETFNSYHLAASGLVREHLMQRFLDTSGRDIVVMAGFWSLWTDDHRTAADACPARTRDSCDHRKRCRAPRAGGRGADDILRRLSSRGLRRRHFTSGCLATPAQCGRYR